MMRGLVQGPSATLAQVTCDPCRYRPDRGMGASRSTTGAWKRFSRYPLGDLGGGPHEGQPDVVLVDGRFRTGCALAAAFHTSNADWCFCLTITKVRRTQYHAVEAGDRRTKGQDHWPYGACSTSCRHRFQPARLSLDYQGAMTHAMTGSPLISLLCDSATNSATKIANMCRSCLIPVGMKASDNGRVRKDSNRTETWEFPDNTTNSFQARVARISQQRRWTALCLLCGVDESGPMSPRARPAPSDPGVVTGR